MNARVVPFSAAKAPPGGSIQKPSAALNSASANPIAAAGRPRIVGGNYKPAQAIALMNSWFFVSECDGEVGIYRIEDDGTLTYLAMEDFKLRLANVFVDMSSPTDQAGSKLVAIDKFWLRNPHRRSCDRIVFLPAGNVGIDEYNLWRGFAVTPIVGWQKQRRLLQHILRIICRRDKAKFKYLIKWLAWTVQNPDQRAEVIVVLMSNTEGSGKSSERITFYPSGVKPKGGGTTAYAWFVWDKQAPGRTEVKWLKPGYKAQFAEAA